MLDKPEQMLSRATTDPEQIKAWAKEHPDANVGIALFGLVAVEIYGPEGRAALSKLMEQYGPLPPTMMVSLGDDYSYALYRLPEGIEVVSGWVVPFVYAKGRDSYVLAPGSRGATGTYELIIGPESPSEFPWGSDGWRASVRPEDL